MPKQEYKIQSFHGGTNNKFDPRDIEDNQNASSSLSIRNPGRLTLEGSAMTLYDKTTINPLTVTDVGAAGTQADPQSFVAGYGLFAFSHDYDLDGDEVDTEFVVSNDKSSINIYDPNKSSPGWYSLGGGASGAGSGTAKFTVGSRLGTVKPAYYNVDGALRVCDSNFAVNTTGLLINMGSGVTKNDITLTHDTGTINAGSIIQIDQEIMYVVTSPNTTTITVIRGYANTKVATHANDATIYYANVPKYFGHIKQDRLFECDTSDSINAWVEDVQTPQPPNNTRKSDGTGGVLASSLGVQSLRVFDVIEGSTTNYPAASEKVILEFEEGQANVGITKVAFTSGTNDVVFTTSGYGNSATDGNRLVQGESINLQGLEGVASIYNGTHTVTSATSNSFTITVDGASTDGDLDYSGAAYITAIADWYDHSESGEIDNALGVNVGQTELPSSAGQIYPIHITGETGVNGFNGIYEARAIDNNDLYIIHNLHGSHASGTTNGQVQQLVGIARPEDADAINEDLKRKWNFAISFTYDGPGQEVQESLLTNGHTIYASKRADGTTNTLAAAMGDTSTTANHDIDDASVFSVGDVIMVDSEQMLITAIDTSASPDHINVERGYNGSAAATHSDDAQIYIISELSPTATVDWTNFIGVPSCVIKTVYNHGVDEKTWNARINGFKIYMRDVTEGDSSKEWRLFSDVNFNKGTYTLFAADDSELILEQPGTWASDGQVCTISTGTELTIKPIDTYLSENLFTEETIIDAQYKAIEVVGRRAYIGNIRQGGRTYPDRMLRTPVNKFDTFPETNFIDVAVGDGDSITALKSFGDRLLQFKKNKVYIINVAGESEILEAEYNNAGIAYPSQVTKTNDGIAWINAAGLWYFDGKQVQNLTTFVEDGGYTLGTDDLAAPKIGFDKKDNRVIYSPEIESALATYWYIYDLNLKAYQSNFIGNLIPFSKLSANYYTNMINDSNGDLIIGYVDDASNTELNFYKWNSDDTGHAYNTATPIEIYKSKDIDFGSPGVRKKIYKVYVTYKSTGHSGVEMKYATDGGTSFSSFSSSKSSNYNVESFTGNGTKTGFKDSSGAWAVAELKPSSSINNIKSIQLSFNTIPITIGVAQSGGSATSILLADGTSPTDGIFNDYNIYVHTGKARYNSRRITNYVGSSETTTLASAMIDKGYDAAPDNTTEYLIGSVAADFEINDITIIYRMKRVK